MDKYDNTQYWTEIHQKLAGSLRSVGWPDLSESYNALKYQSESETVISLFEKIFRDAKFNCSEHIKIFEIGSGIGLWTGLISRFFREKGIATQFTCLDISTSALDIVKVTNPWVKTWCADLRTIKAKDTTTQYDIVYAFMVLLHLTNLEEFLNGLSFCADSVKLGGYLLVYDPILLLDYSPFNHIDIYKFKGNSIAYRMQIYDSVLQKRGLKKIDIAPGISFLLNSCLQAPNKLTLIIGRTIWKHMCRYVYKNDNITKLLGPIILKLDRQIKNSIFAMSSYIAVYRKDAM